jgi:uncharacterized protein (TIGR01777 family)
MATIRRAYRSPIAAPAEELAAWHNRPGTFDRLTPAWAGARVVASSGTTRPGDWKELEVRAFGPLAVSWKLAHELGDTPLGFTDVQQSGPFRSWRHVHRFLPELESASILEDELTVELPYGAAGAALMEGRLEAMLDRLFRFRHDRTRQDVERHFGAAISRPSRIAVTGASGLVGSRLVPFLQAGGHHVHSLVRRKPRRPDEIFWDPGRGEIDARALEGMDAVVHLAGVSIASLRWTASRKEAILRSRVEGTELLARTLAGLSRKPAVLLSASGVGYYGDGGSEVLTESSPRGEGFLAGVVGAWERATEPASEAGIRVVTTRQGIVLAAEGGMLPLISRVYALGMGGALGSGQQDMSWIALDDLLAIFLEVMANPRLEGPVNAVAPGTVTNQEFSETLGRVLHRPSFMRVPAFAMKLAAGEMGKELILYSQRAQPVRLQQEGFVFALPSLEAALRHEFGRYAAAPAALAAPLESASGAAALQPESVIPR